MNKTSAHKLALSITSTILAACAAQAYDLNLGTNIPPITVHGLASQGYLLSSDYNYLANDTKNGSFQYSEFGLNLSMNPFPHTRVAVQGYDFDVGNAGQYDPFLDYALIEYTVNDEFGIRAGRIRRPSGIYNAIQDIDLARTFVLLPQGIYDSRWRDWSAGLDGAEVFGEIPLHKLGSLSYELYGGQVEMEENGGIARYIDGTGTSVVDTLDDCPSYGGQVWWNTPLDGLRFGASFSYLSNFGFTLTPAGLPITVHSIGDSVTQQYSAEYLWKNWTFQAEFYTYDFTGTQYYSAFLPPSGTSDNPDSWYGAVSYRINKYAQVGTYYSSFLDGSQKQNDIALSLRLDLTDWWVFKIEGHAINGTGLLRDQQDNPHTSDNSYWYMLAVKTTFSF
jgi:hypothetical protein